MPETIKITKILTEPGLEALIQNIDDHYAPIEHKHTKTEITDFPTLKGSGATTVTQDSNGNYTISSTDNNTVYTHPTSGVTADTYKSVTVNAQGHVIGGTNPTTLAGYGITDAESKGAANTALSNAKTYTNEQINTAKADIQDKLDEKADADHIHAADTALSTTSTNPVQNKVVNTALSGKVPTTRTINGKALSTNITLNASDVGADASGSAATALADAKTYADGITTNLSSHTDNSTIHVTSDNKTQWNAAYSHSTSAHAPTTAEKNIIVGIQKNGADLTVDSSTRKVNITVPTTASEVGADPSGSASSALSSAKTYTNEQIAGVQADIDDLNEHVANNDIHFTTTERTKLSGIAAGAQVNTITGVKGSSENSYRTGNVNITKANIGLGNVDNTSDANKPVSTAQQTAINTALSSAKSYADGLIDEIMGEGAAETLNTIGEISTAIQENESAMDALNDAIGNKADKTHTHTITASASDDDVVILSGTNGSNKVTYTASHADSGVTAGTYKSVTVNAKGHITAGTNPTTLSGYGITNAYTKTETDNLIDTIDWFSSGTSIPSSSDLDTYTTPGKYFIGSESAAQTLLNCPTTTNFCLYVIVRTNGSSKTQLLIALNGKLYIRSCNSSGVWRDWQHYATQSDLNTLQTTIEEALALKANSSHTHSISNITDLQQALDDKAAASHGTHVTYGTSATAVGASASAGTATTVSRSDHTHSLSKSAVTTALGYTPPTTNTTYGVATSSTLGLVKSGTDITVDASGNVSVNNNSHTHTLSNISDITATATEVNILDGATVTTDEINYLDGVTSGIQAQLDSKAASNHGNHVPATQTANNAKFLRNDNTWQTVTPANIGAAAASHGTHVSYGSSATAVGTTTSAGTAATVSRSDHVHSLPVASSTVIGGVKTSSTVTSTSGLTATPIIDGIPYYKDTNTKVTNTLNTTTKAYVTGTTSSSTNTGTQVFDTGVYLDTVAGRLCVDSIVIGGKVLLTYNANDACLDVSFL